MNEQSEKLKERIFNLAEHNPYGGYDLVRHILQACKEADLRFAYRRVHSDCEPYWEFEEIDYE